MTDPVTDLGEIVVVGQRRSSPSDPFPERPEPATGPVDPNDATVDEGGQGFEDPCADPDTARDWNADAASASTGKDLKVFARSTHPNEQDFDDREYGAALWERADGSVVRGTMTFGEHTFYEAAQLAGQGLPARAGVVIDWTPPFPDAVIIGMIHTHPTGGTTPSGGNYSQDDQGNLSYVQDLREFQGKSGLQGRIYIASNKPGEYETPGETKINVYDHRNRDAAIAGQEGPEVNPEGQSCS